MTHHLPVPLAILLFVAAGCHSSGTDVSTRIDVDTVPFLDLHESADAPDQLMEYPTGATRLSNGNIVVNDYYAARVLYFSPGGELVRAIGGHGGGPKEFGHATVRRGRCARDSVFIFVFDKGVNAVLDSAGKVGRTYRPSLHSGPSTCKWNDEAVYWTMEQPFTRAPREGDPPLKLQLSAGHGESASHEIGRFESDYGPLRPETHAEIANGFVYVGLARDGKIEKFTARGKKVATVETGATRRPTSDKMYDATLDQYVTYLVVESDRTEMKALMRKRYHRPDRTPAYKTFLVDSLQTIWVKTSAAGEDGSDFVLVSGVSGARQGKIHFQQDVRLFEVGRDYLIGYFEDDDGYPHVALYRVTRS